MKRKITSVGALTALLLMLSPLVFIAQNTFMKIYPTTYDKSAREVLPMSDGGYIMAGYTNDSDINDCNVYVLKTNSNGDTLWTHTYGGAKPDYAYSMLLASDGNYFILGYTQSYGPGDHDIYLLKINPTGGEIWHKTYGTSSNEEGREIIPTSDGNYMIVGSTEVNTNVASGDICLIKIDVNGAVLWTKYYGGSNKENGNSVKQMPDGGYIVTGQTFTWGSNGDAYVVRTNSSGDTLWTKYYGGPNVDEGISIVQNGDGSSTFIVRDSSYGAGDIDTRITKIDQNGGITWSKIYGGTQKDTPKRIRSTSDGGYIVGSISRSFGWINPDMWLLKLTATGDTSWTRHYGGSDHEHCYDVKQASDGGYLACGHSKSYSPGQKIMFLKLNSAGLLNAVGVPNLVMNNFFSIYPNPVENRLNLKFENQPDAASVRINDALGREVYSRVFETGGIEPIEMQDQKPGVYFISVQSGSLYATQKIILK